jgi:hypothetical protein
MASHVRGIIMKSARRILQDSLYTGAAASFATTAAAAVCGTLENITLVAPINAVSHIAWGDEAAVQDHPSGKYTATGLALNTAAVTSWAALYELFFGDFADEGDVAKALLAGTAVSAAAYVTDYYVVPKRFTPGFEKQLSGGSLLAIYGTLAVGLALGSLARAARRGVEH